MTHVQFNKFSTAATQFFKEPRLVVKDGQVVAAPEKATKMIWPFNRLTQQDLAEIEENRTAWSVFLTSVEKIVGRERAFAARQRLEKRYDIRAKIARGSPLSTRVVLATALLLKNPTTRELKKKGDISLKRLTTKALEVRIRKHGSEIQVDTSCLPHANKIYGTPMFDEGYYVHNREGMDLQTYKMKENLEEIGKVKNSYHQKDEKILEKVGSLARLAKVMVNFEMDNKTIIPLKMNGKIVNYKIYKRIAGKGLWAYALKPIIDHQLIYPESKKARPPAIILFRQTQSTPSAFDVVDSLKNDFQARLGTLGYEACCHDLQMLAKDEKFLRGSNLLVSGYSLGGNHAQHFLKGYCESRVVKEKLLSDPDFQIEAFIFNAPKLSVKDASEFAENMNCMPVPDTLPKKNGKISPKVVLRFIHNTNKFKTSSGEDTITDPAGLVCDQGLGCNVNHPLLKVVEYEVQFKTDKKMDVMFLHSERGFDNEDIPYSILVRKGKQAQMAIDNTRLDAHMRSWERLRRTWGVILSHTLTVAVKIIACIFRPCGFSFRTSEIIELKSRCEK